MTTKLNNDWKHNFWNKITSEDVMMLSFILNNVKREKRTDLHKYVSGKYTDGSRNDLPRIDKLVTNLNYALSNLEKEGK